MKQSEIVQADQCVSRTCRCERAECRPDQRNCLLCHKEANAAYRLRRKAEAAITRMQLNRFAQINARLTARLGTH
jgi:hypothetical protein